MNVLYVHLLRFPLQRRMLETPSLAGQPVVLWEEQQGVRRIAFASSRAQKAGIRAGMTLTAATALEPGLTPFPFEAPLEAKALLSLGEALLSLAPRFQLSSPDGLWLDPSGAHLVGGSEALCHRVIEACQAQGYRARVAHGKGLFTTRALSRFGEERVSCVEWGEEAGALAVLPLSALEWLEPGTRAQLGSLGLKRLGEVAALPAGALVARFGSEGLRLHRLCRGEDDTLLVPQALPEVLEESIDLDWPAESQEPLLFGLKTLLDRLCARLYGRKVCAVRVCFGLRLDSREQVTLPLTLARPTSQAKLLLDLARHRMADLTLQSPVCGLSVKVEELCEDPGQQLGLGDTPDAEMPLEVVLSKLSSTLGQEALFSAGVAKKHRPEEGYARGQFRPPSRARGLLAELRPRTVEETGVVLDEGPGGLAPVEKEGERPSRLFAKPATLDAELDEEGELRAARLLGRRRRVTALAGPERLAGDWWEATFSRDYYRVHFEGVGPVWIFRDERDGRFYLQGMFD